MEALKQILLNLPQSFISGLMLNGTIILLAYFFVWKKFKKRLQHWKIQIKERVDSKQIKRELKNSLFTLLVGATFSSIVIYLSTKGYTKIYTNISDHSLFFALGGFFVLLLLDDTWFYWCHRLLHHPKIFKYVHLEHHKSVDVNPFTSMSFHFIEPFLLSFWIFPVSYFFPIYAPVLMLIQIWGLLDNVKSHLGYELYPSWWNKSVFRFLTSSTHHNMHHSKFNGNYGVHFRIWDKLLGTEFKDYENEYEKIQERKKSNVSRTLISIGLLFISLTAFSQNNLIGKWIDKDHKEKKVEMYVASNNKIYGKDNNGKTIFKEFVYNATTDTYNGILVNPDNNEEFKIIVKQLSVDTFTFTVKKFIFTKQFKFERDKGSR